MDVSFSNLKDQIFLAITQYGGKILLALIVFIIGRKIITKASQF
jgi:small conductance mechanosensitive channel